jgi:phosphatidate cytidylyltransferase
VTHLFSTRGIFDSPVTLWCTIAAIAALAITPLIMLLLTAMGKVSGHTRADVWRRYRTWLVLVPATLIPILVAPIGAMLLVLVVSILCYREFARATGLFRERLLSAIVVLGIVLVFGVAIDHWYAMFVAIPPLMIVIIAAVAVLEDRPSGYLQRVSLAAIGFLLFGFGLGHLAYIANDANYRAILCMLLLCVQFGDILAYMFGKAFGRRKVFINTSPNKTLAGHLGALAIVTPLAAWLTHIVFKGTPLDATLYLIMLGLIIAAGAQLGDLVLASIKRDLGLKDLATTLPGHGGFTDRCNSLLLVAPAAFHFIGYFVGFGVARPERIFTG